MQKKPIGILAIDIDETLIDDDGNVPQKNINAIKKAKELGYIIVVSTTRGYGICKDIAYKVDADYICSQNGNMISDVNGKTFYKNPFEKSHVKEFLDRFASSASIIIFDLEHGGLFGQSPHTSKKFPFTKMSISELYKTEPFKMSINQSEDDKFNQEVEDFAEKYGFRCKKMRGGNTYLILRNNDKFFAVEKVMDWLGLSNDQLIVFGDDNTDKLSMQKAKTSVAVANAIDEIKNIATYVTSSNNEGGVGEFIEKYILNSKRNIKKN